MQPGDGAERRALTWADAPEWRDPARAARADALRRDLERETSTLRGFRRRIRTDREWSILGLILGVPVLVFTLADPIQTLPTVGFSAVWERMLTERRLWWVALGVVLIGIAMVSSAVRVRREFAWFRQNGWIALQANTGLTEVHSEGPTYLGYDYRLVGGAADSLVRKFGDPVMLISPADMAIGTFSGAVAAVRASTVARSRGDEMLNRLRQQLGKLRAVPAEPWFANTGGCFVGPTTDAPLVAAIPRTVADGQRIRLGRIRLSADERASLA